MTQPEPQNVTVNADPTAVAQTATVVSEPTTNPEYAPPRAEQPTPTVSSLEDGSVMVSVVRDGERYAVTAANEADAHAMLESDPASCRVPNY